MDKPKRGLTRGMAVADNEKSPTASPKVIENAKKSWGQIRAVLQSTEAFTASQTRKSRAETDEALKEPFLNLVLLSLKSVVEAQQTDAKVRQLVTRWQITPPNNKLSVKESGEISNKSLFLLTVSDNC